MSKKFSNFPKLSLKYRYPLLKLATVSRIETQDWKISLLKILIILFLAISDDLGKVVGELVNVMTEDESQSELTEDGQSVESVNNGIQPEK